MSCELKIPRQADQEFSIKVKDESGTLIDCSIVSQAVIVLHYEDKTVLAKYSVTGYGSGGWKQINNDLAEGGELRVKLEGVDTESANLGKIFYELRLRFPDGTYPDGQDDKISSMNYLFTLIDSVTKDITLP